jgi:hypothetical protein
VTRYQPIALLFFVLPASVQLEASPLANPHVVRGAAASQKCSMDSLPETDKRRMIQEYQRRLRADGKASADAWARVQGNLAYRKLAAQGICPPLRGTGGRTAAIPNRTGKKPLLNKQGKRCTRMEVENQVFPGFGGEPMTMGLVPVCKD